VVDVRPAVQEEGEDVQVAAEARHHQRAAPKPVLQTTSLLTILEANYVDFQLIRTLRGLLS
jgi:hypothetical protein